ncbi:hypothetical protein T4C_5547 [Trichinella pseudospiralis]|uniref:Uncharacterized protein n=1 Tax=Trichinella pseudospiralis TaxID=6337 RepID=A0A0V1GLR7_TRIPS|nr:hypothetical protein T4C_5547 [Trichinella pseudospiralis]
MSNQSAPVGCFLILQSYPKKNDNITELGICHLYKKKTGIFHACSVPL